MSTLMVMDANIAKHFVSFTIRKLGQPKALIAIVILIAAMILHFGFGFKFYATNSPRIASFIFYTVLTLGIGMFLASDRKKVIPSLLYVSVLLWCVQAFPMHSLMMKIAPWYTTQFIAALAYNVKALLFFLIIPATLLRFSSSAKTVDVIASNRIETPWKWYALILLVMSVLVFWAAGELSFQRMYPRYKPGYFETSSSWTYAQILVLYEISYALHFVAVEWFFRSFLLRSQAKFLGNSSVVFATIIYVLIHFTKPFPEALGSALGGFGLCFLVMRTKSIKGGLVLHLGVAMMMEFFAYWRAEI